MNKIKQHFPNFCEGFERKEQEFETVEELLRIPFVKKWSEDSEFYRYSQSARERGDIKQILLMAEIKKGFEWYVIGYLEEETDLPVLVLNVTHRRPNE